MIDEGALTLFLLITARMSGLVLFNPLLSRQNIPGFFRAGFTLVLSAFTYSVTGGRVEPPSGVLPLAGALLLEVVLGLVLGLAAIQRKEYYRVFPVLGILLNLAALVGIGLILYLGSSL